MQVPRVQEIFTVESGLPMGTVVMRCDASKGSLKERAALFPEGVS